MNKKINVGLIGINGRMCRAVIDTVLKNSTDHERVEIVAGVEKDSSILAGKRFEDIPELASFMELARLRVYGNIHEVKEQVNVWIDFSLPDSTLYHLENLNEEDVGYVIGTTGFTEKQLEQIHFHAEKRPLVMSGNFSIGINLLLYILEKLLIVPAISPFDIEVLETHHRMKVDAPSGTAQMIVNKIQEIKKLSNKYLVYDRHRTQGVRQDNEVGITSRRGGGVIGEHEIGFYGDNEILTVKHTAINRSAFSYGVIESIKFINRKLEEGKKGLFGIRDVLNLE